MKTEKEIIQELNSSIHEDDTRLTSSDSSANAPQIKLPRAIAGLSKNKQKLAVEKLNFYHDFNQLQSSEGNQNATSEEREQEYYQNIMQYADKVGDNMQDLSCDHTLLELMWRNGLYKEDETWHKLCTLINQMRSVYANSAKADIKEILYIVGEMLKESKRQWQVCHQDKNKAILLDMIFSWTQVLISYVSPWMSVNKKYSTYQSFMDLGRKNADSKQHCFFSHKILDWFKQLYTPQLLKLALKDVTNLKSFEVAKKLLIARVNTLGSILSEEKDVLSIALQTGTDRPLIDYANTEDKKDLLKILSLNNAEVNKRFYMLTHNQSHANAFLAVLARAQNPKYFSIYYDLLTGNFDKVIFELKTRKAESESITATNTELALPFLLTLKDKNDLTILHYLAGRDELDLLCWLLSFFNDTAKSNAIHALDAHQEQPLNHAILHNQAAMAAFFTLHQGFVGDTEKFFNTIDNISTCTGDSLLHLLINLYMNPDENKNILANRAIERLISINENRFVKTLLIPNIAGKMPIEIIVEKNMISLLRYIFNTAVVEGKVSFQNFKDLFSRTSTQGETLLLLAIRLESTQMLKEILVCAEKFGWGNEKIVGINTVNFDGNTALHLAFLKNNYLLANQLIAFGASCLKENNNNQFPLDILLEKSNDYTLLNFLMQESCLLLDEYAIERFIDTYKRNIDDIKKISMFTALALQKLFNKLNDQLTSSSLKTRQTATFTLLHTLTATKFALKMNQDPDKKVLVLNNCESQTRRSKFFRNIVKPLTILLAILTCTIAGAVVGAALGAIVSGGLGTVPGALLGLFAGALAAPAIVGGCLSSIAITSGCLWYQYRSKDKAVADVIHAANDDLIFFKSNYRKSLMP